VDWIDMHLLEVKVNSNFVDRS